MSGNVEFDEVFDFMFLKGVFLRFLEVFETYFLAFYTFWQNVNSKTFGRSAEIRWTLKSFIKVQM